VSRRSIAVVVTTYNQESYIGQCIDSILSQKSDADFTVYVHDDASDDGTRSIIENYAYRFPEKIVLIQSEFNKLSNRKSPILDMVRLVDEEFIAFCSGDDYWTDPRKLDLQINVFLNDSKVGLVHTAFRLLNSENEGSEPLSEPLHTRNARSKLSSARDFVTGCQAKESTVMIRKSKVNFDFLKGADHLRASDWILYLSVSLKSEIRFLEQETAVHRFSARGVWNGALLEHRERMKNEIRWYAASNCPDDQLRHEFRLRVCKDFLLANLKKNFFLRNLLKISEPIRHPLRMISNLRKTLHESQFR
jgi:glycosyltransferase involved in cell wall biosynthesis